MIGHVALDFDGTLVRSNQIKRDCFHETLADVPGAAAILDDLFASGYRGDRLALFGEVARRLGPGGMIGVPESDELAASYGRLCRERIAAALGPCIGPQSYEVGPEFRERFTGNEAFFQPATREDHYLFDLPAYIEARLRGLGLASVEILAADTRPENSDFFSYRRACLNGEPDYGRNLSAIMLER